MTPVDIILSTFNRGSYFLPRAIRSVQAQTYTDWTLWVCDDCSTDDTARVVRQFAAADPRIRYLCQQQNSGYQCAPKNQGIRASSAPLIAYIDDDNEWLPDHLMKLVTSLEAASADAVYCAREYRNDPEQPMKDPPCLGAHMPWGLPQIMSWEPARLAFENWIDTSDLLHTRAAIVQLGGWNEEARRGADWDLMRRAALADWKVTNVPEVLTIYYWHGAGNVGRVSLVRPAVWTLTKNRLYFVQQSFLWARKLSGLMFDHYVLDQGSVDGTAEWLVEQYQAGLVSYLRLEPQNIGISRGSNHLLDIILADDVHQTICKLDSDITMQTPRWLERLIVRCPEKHVLSPHILGLEHHPGGDRRTSFDSQRRLGYVKHLGGACNLAPRQAWEDFGRWVVPAPAHGTQDAEFSQRLRDKGWRFAHAEDILARHLGNTPMDVRAAERALIV